MNFDSTRLAIAALAWLAGLGGAAVATRIYLRWHWFEICRAHKRLDAVEHRVSTLERGTP